MLLGGSLRIRATRLGRRGLILRLGGLRLRLILGLRASGWLSWELQAAHRAEGCTDGVLLTTSGALNRFHHLFFSCCRQQCRPA